VYVDLRKTCSHVKGRFERSSLCHGTLFQVARRRYILFCLGIEVVSSQKRREAILNVYPMTICSVLRSGTCAALCGCWMITHSCEVEGSQCFHMGLSWNRGTPISSFLVGFCIINHPAIGVAPFPETPICFPIPMPGAEKLLDQQEEEAPQLRQPRSVNGAPVPESLGEPEPRYMCYMCYLSLIWQRKHKKNDPNKNSLGHWTSVVKSLIRQRIYDHNWCHVISHWTSVVVIFWDSRFRIKRATLGPSWRSLW
jgi:hypothetical protein